MTYDNDIINFRTHGLWTKTATANMALLQAGLTPQLQPLLLSITFGAWRQVSAFKPRLQQALKRYRKPYWRPFNPKPTDMKRTFSDNLGQQLTPLPMPTPQEKKQNKLPTHEKILMPPHIAHICLCPSTQDANAGAKSKECNRQRFISSVAKPTFEVKQISYFVASC